MNFRNITSVLLLSSLFLVGCGGEGEGNNGEGNNAVDTASVDFADMSEMSLRENDLNLSLMLPEVESATGSSIDALVEHDEGDYLWYLSIGPRFQMVIEDFGKEKEKVAQEKKRLAGLGDIFDIEYLIDEPNLIMYKRNLHEGQGGKASYHCYGEVLIDGYNYVLRSGEEGSLKPIIEDMVKTIRSAKPIAQA